MADESSETLRAENQDAPVTPAAQETPTGGQPETQTFTQADLDKMFAARAKQAKQAAQSELLKALGVDSLDTLKAVLKEATSLKASQMSDAEKLQAKMDKVTKRASELEAELNQERQARREAVRDVAIEKAAVGAEIPADVVTWAQVHATEELAKTLDDDGAVDESAVKALVEKCRKARPNWFTAGGPGSPSNNGGKIPTPAKLDEKAREAAFRSIRRGI